MRISKFKRLKTIEKDKEEEMNKLMVGECFLYGKNVVAQKETKKVGQSITYYQVISKSNNSVEYTPIFDYMEEEKGEKI